MTPTDHLVESRSAGVLWVTIARAEKRNALNRALLAGLGERFRRHAADPDLRLAVLTAEGDQCFAAGGDLHELEAVRSDLAARDLTESATSALDAIREFPVPVLAALNGAALGGGAELALACDLRITAPTTTIGFLQAKLALSPGFGGGADLARLVGTARAMLLLARAEVLNAIEAHRIGLVDAIADEGVPFPEFVENFVTALAANPPQVMRAIKTITLDERRGRAQAERATREQCTFVETWLHDDHWAATRRIRAAMRQPARSEP